MGLVLFSKHRNPHPHSSSHPLNIFPGSRSSSPYQGTLSDSHCALQDQVGATSPGNAIQTKRDFQHRLRKVSSPFLPLLSDLSAPKENIEIITYMEKIYKIIHGCKWPTIVPWRCFSLPWEEGLFLFPQVPRHLRSLHQLAACCCNRLVNVDCSVNYKHILKSFFLAFFLEWVTATPQLTEWSSIVFSQGSGRNMPHRDSIIYQHNVGFKPMRHQYIFLWSLTYCLLLSMLFSWLADKITVAVSKITSNSSCRGEVSYDRFILQTLSSFSFGVQRWFPERALCMGLWQPLAPALGSVLDKAIQERV